ncbi:manganese efflux pump MntP [Stieleria magnilauensis]|uniref:Manganese efflux pump MntP n=2 Tax=Stieleria magnilauensis TaxID=2527963 RepID=A0ABX5XHC6_9BACT|nr:manganese efflux pump MntP [Planctomycetes bacterium TBK1r]
MTAAAAASIDCLAAGTGVAIDGTNVSLVLIAIGIGSGLASALGAFLGRKMLCVGIGNAECIGGLSLFLFAGVSWIW